MGGLRHPPGSGGFLSHVLQLSQCFVRFAVFHKSSHQLDVPWAHACIPIPCQMPWAPTHKQAHAPCLAQMPSAAAASCGGTAEAHQLRARLAHAPNHCASARALQPGALKAPAAGRRRPQLAPDLGPCSRSRLRSFAGPAHGNAPATRPNRPACHGLLHGSHALR